jgi:capsular exopolysaccharide synthesis family protein
MSDDLVPASQSPYAATQLQQWQEQPQYGAPNPAKSPLDRPLAAILRYKWLMLAVVVLSTLAGVAATRLLTEQYEVQARIMIMTGNNQGEDRLGPIRSPGLLQPDDWTQLIRSFAIVDPVVRKLSLFLTPTRASDADVFRGFTVADSFRAGKFQLDIDRAKQHWVLMIAASKFALDSGTAADSIGRKLGFRWVLPPEALHGQGVRSVEFTVSTLRESAVQLTYRVNPHRSERSNFVWLTFEDRDPQRAAEILNEWVRQFVDIAADLKKQKLTEFSRTLEGQLQTQKQALDDAEKELETFRVQTITQPSEGAPVAAGLQETRDPVFKAFFDKSFEYEEIHRDVQFLRSLIRNLGRDSVPSDALLQINSVAAGPASRALQDAVNAYHAARANLASQRLIYKDEHPVIKQAVAELNSLKNEKIPLYANELLTTLRTREVEDSVRVGGMKVNLQEIPPRTIEEERLRRKRDAAARLFTDLQARHSEAELAEKSSTPDISVLDWAVAPLHPTKNTKPRLILMAFAGGIGAALALAILLDRIDGRLRYPEQATDDLGLPVAGTVPRFPKGGIDLNSAEQTYQLVESFRSLRMTVLQSGRGGPVTVAVSSPSPGEGKSLISANLALSFADAGLRTVLVDGDTRRGALHEMFGLQIAPGLTDYLGGGVDLKRVLMPTSHPALSVIAGGTRRRRSPEMITSPRLGALVEELRATHDVVIFDTPPFAAGVDGYAIASATGRLLVVLRVGKTARRMAAEKLRALDRLPVEVVGAVLNGIQLSGAYTYYGYVPGYEAEDEPEETAIVKMT